MSYRHYAQEPRLFESCRTGRAEAFSLVEVTLALGVAAFCFLVIFGLLPTALNSTRDTVHQTAAAGLATNVIADLRSTAATSTSSPLYNISMSVTPTTKYLMEDGSTNASAAGNGGSPVYRATVAVYPPPAATPHAATTAWIQITWPATVNPASQTPSGDYETVVGLDRN